MRTVAALVAVLFLTVSAVPVLALHETPRPYEPFLPRFGPLQNYPHPIDGDNKEGCYPQHPEGGGNFDFRVDLPCRNAAGGLGLVPGGPFIDNAYMGDEPNTITPFEKPYGTFPADRNGIARALQGTGSPSLILNAKMGNYCLYDGDWVCTYNEYIGLYFPFVDAPDFILPLTADSTVYYGWWTDVNQDGYITDTDSYPDMFVFYSPHRDLATAADEWRNPDRLKGECSRIMGYLWPHNVAGATRDDQADLVYDPSGVCGKGLQRVNSGGFALMDLSILETIVTEVYNNVTHTPGLAREWTQEGPDGLVDVDVYAAVDPTLEDLYVEQVRVRRDAAIAAANAAIVEAIDTVESVAPLVGGAAAPLIATAVQTMFPAVTGTEVTGHPHASGFYPYLDVHLAPYETTCHVFCAAWQGGQLTPPAGLEGQESYMPGWVAAVARFGYWHDKNGDGWIGEPGTASLCGDVYDCGLNPDPNRYTVEESDGEFFPVCATLDTPTGPQVQEFHVTLVPDTPGARWVAQPVGVEVPNGGGRNGIFAASGQTTHFGNGVVVFDDPPGAQDTEVIFGHGIGNLGFVLSGGAGTPYLVPEGYHAHTVEEGPVTLRLYCAPAVGGPPGQYQSWETLYFPTGNMDFDIELTSTALRSVAAPLGITTIEGVSDADTIVAWG